MQTGDAVYEFGSPPTHLLSQDDQIGTQQDTKQDRAHGQTSDGMSL
jgi:hypothetical protein